MEPTSEKVVVKLRGLPFSINEAGISSFLNDVALREIRFVQKSDGQMSGEAFVVVDTDEAAQVILAHNGGMIGRRFIEIQMSSKEQMDWFLRKTPKPDGTVRLIGLPYEIDKEQLKEFFQGMEIVPNGIGLLTDRNIRPTGEAYIQFASMEVAKLALTKDRQRIGSRYVEIYPSSLRAATQAIERQMYLNMDVDPNTTKSNDQTWTNPLYDGSQSGYYPASQTNANDGYQPNMTSYPPPPPPTSGQQLLGGRPYAAAILEAAGLSNYYPSYNNGTTHLQQQQPQHHQQLQHHQQPQQWSTAPYSNNPYGYYPTTVPETSAANSEEPTGNSKLHIRMRGLPYTATAQDVIEFFQPIQPLKINLRSNRNGLPNGMADVHFARIEDTRNAMKRQKALMGTRYIELFSDV